MSLCKPVSINADKGLKKIVLREMEVLHFGFAAHSIGRTLYSLVFKPSLCFGHDFSLVNAKRSTVLDQNIIETKSAT